MPDRKIITATSLLGSMFGGVDLEAPTDVPEDRDHPNARVEKDADFKKSPAITQAVVTARTRAQRALKGK